MGRNEKGRFEKGTSGNPSGRPKLSEVEKDTIESISQLAPKAVHELEKILTGSKINNAVKLKAIDTVLERVCGKASGLKQVSDEPVRIIIDV